MASYRKTYYSETGLTTSLDHLKNCEELNPADIQCILDYVEDMLAKSISAQRLRKCVLFLKKYAVQLKKLNTDFRNADVSHIRKLIIDFDSNPKYSEYTKVDFKKILKRFYKWLLGNDEEAPKLVKWIKAKKPKNCILPEDILTEEEVLQLIDRANNLRDKALIYTLYESGARIGELLGLEIKDIVFGEHVTSITVKGKTGQRRIPLVACTNYLANWLTIHPFKKNPSAPLWPALYESAHTTLEPITHTTARKLLRVIAEKADIKKRVNPHSFRHSRATHLAKKLTEAQLKMYFGWTQESDMASRYVHLSGRDIDTAILATYGIKDKETEEETKIGQIICKRCQEKNSSNFSLCKKCGNALNEKIAMQVIENKQGQSYEFLNNVVSQLKDLENKGLNLKQFSEFLNEWSKNKTAKGMT
ncbi:MAG: tyrosine-type recombinase/integrase [Candidatus Diapherotrites archaeon]|nr:tyrosine-type recombinase/integrase [Candidatus Diapherotrites archaeon]